jgi:TonB family protein
MPIQRKPRNSAKVNLVVSFVFHAIIILALVFLAAREGYLGKQLKTIAVTMAPREKPPEKPKEEKPPEPKPEPPKTEEPKPAAAAATQAPPPASAPPAAASTAPIAAPPAAALPGFAFSDGAKAVETTSDPIQLYRGFVEFALRSKWIRPDGISDESYVAEVEVSVDAKGNVTQTTWKQGSGNTTWDDSVRRAVAATKALSRPPPKGFPPTFLVRFDVVPETDPTTGATLSVP